MRTEKSRRLGWVQKTIRTISGDRSFLFETSFVDASTENHFAFWCTKTQPNTLDPLISARTTRWISLRRIDSQYRFSLQATGFSTSKSKMLPPPPTKKRKRERDQVMQTWDKRSQASNLCRYRCRYRSRYTINKSPSFCQSPLF